MPLKYLSLAWRRNDILPARRRNVLIQHGDAMRPTGQYEVGRPMISFVPLTVKRLSYARRLALKSQCVYVKVRSPRQPAAIASNPSRCVGTLKVCSWILRRSLVNLRRLQHCMRRIAQERPRVQVVHERSLYTAPSLRPRYAPGPPFVD